MMMLKNLMKFLLHSSCCFFGLRIRETLCLSPAVVGWGRFVPIYGVNLAIKPSPTVTGVMCRFGMFSSIKYSN